MDVEKEAREIALKELAALFQRPDQLERLPELKKRSERKKTAVDAMLRTGVQSQLEGTRSAISQLQTVSEDVVAIETETEEIRIRLKPFPKLQQQMTALREWSVRHDQYAAAIENLRLILHMHPIITETRKALEDGQMLLVHKNIMDLERARDELMYEVHKLNSTTMEKDKKSLLIFFKDVDELVERMWSDMKMVFKRCLEMVRGNDKGDGPQQLVSCLRVVEREERIDKYYLDRQVAMNKFMPPGRPREWRKKMMEAVGDNVRQRVEGNQIEHDRSVSSAWLARYLETCRNVVINDLIMARTASVTCFPKEYQMYDRFVNMYHVGVRRKLHDLISEVEMNKAEIVQLLKWINEYTGENLLGNPRLEINAVALCADQPLLPPDVMMQLQDKFLAMTRSDMTTWLQRTLDQEKDDWYKNVLPETDAEDNFYTPMPSILFGMLEDTLNLAKEFSVDVLPNVIDMAMQEFLPFVAKYKGATVAFKNVHFEQRNRFTTYTATMIAVGNNMLSCAESTEKYLRQIRLSMEEESNTPFSSARGGHHMRRADVIEHVTKLVEAWQTASGAIVTHLFEEVLMDVLPHLNSIFTRQWMEGSDSLGIVMETLRDYHNDHSHLKTPLLLVLAQQIQVKVVGEYLKAVESRRLTFAADSERKRAADTLRNDARRIANIITLYVPEEELQRFTPMHSIIDSMAEVIELTDKSIISLEVAGFARKFPNCPNDVLAALLGLREDIGRAEAKQMADDVLAHTIHHPKDEAFGELFASSRADGSSWSASGVAGVSAAKNKIANILRDPNMLNRFGN